MFFLDFARLIMRCFISHIKKYYGNLRKSIVFIGKTMKVNWSKGIQRLYKILAELFDFIGFFTVFYLLIIKMTSSIKARTLPAAFEFYFNGFFQELYFFFIKNDFKKSKNITCCIWSSQTPICRILYKSLLDDQGAYPVFGVEPWDVPKVLVDRDPVLEPGDLGNRLTWDFGLQNALLAFL